jgi:hypothetical protein
MVLPAYNLNIPTIVLHKQAGAQSLHIKENKTGYPQPDCPDILLCFFACWFLLRIN